MAAESQSLTINQAKESLRDLLTALTTEDVASRLNDARAEAGNDMVKYMQIVFPLVVQTQAEIIEKHGFYGERATVAFMQMVKGLEGEDPELAELTSRVRDYYLPPLGDPKES